MKKNLFTVAVFTFFLVACTKTDKPLEADARQKGEVSEFSNSFTASKTAQAAVNFNAPNVFPEGVVYDPFNDRFLVSSVSMGTIGAVTPKGIYSVFIKDADLVSTVGMEIDKARKRLLVANSNIDGSVAQLAVYDLTNKTRIFLVNLASVANDGYPHFANDVAVDQQGNAYVTDSYAGLIYKVDRYGKANILFKNPAFTPAPGGFGFNGIEYSTSKQGYLLVAHTALNRIVKIPVDMPASYTTVQLTAAISGADGLLLSKDSKQLIIVNNSGQMPGSKVMTFETSNDWANAKSTASFSTGIVYPTTVTSDGKTTYVLYSYINEFINGLSRQTFTIQPLPFISNHPF
jgi:sugar lactone lactonase YvrE